MSTSEVTAANQSAAPPKACVLNLPVACLLAVELACGESRVSTTNGAPSAFGAGSVAGVDLVGTTLLDPITALLQSLLAQLLPVVDQTVGAVLGTLTPVLGSLLGGLAGNLGLGSTSTVGPVSGLVDGLLDGIDRATQLLDIKVGDSNATAATSATAVTATAIAAGAQIDLLPGLTLGGAPLLSIIVGQAKSVSTFDRRHGQEHAHLRRRRRPACASVSPSWAPPVTDIPIQLNQPLTLLAGTPLETTISLGAGRTVTDPNTGAVASYADGVSIQLLKGLNGGIGLELAHAETRRRRPDPPGQPAADGVPPVVPVLAKTGNDPWLPLAGAGLLLVALGIRRRVTAAQPRPHRRAGEPVISIDRW